MKPTPDDFKKFRNPVRGTRQAEDLTNPFWIWCIQTNDSAYGNNLEFEGPSSFDVGPCWSFDRFGQTETHLPDARIICIGGEHEDSYDPDFYIYNDVVILTPEGKTTILCYPESDFPPTDFHTATLVDDEIILIGSLGYPDQRHPTQTQVLRLNTNDWSITRQLTVNNPGWISHHTAEYDTEKNAIRIIDPQQWTEENDLFDTFAIWELNLETWQWHCVEKKNWSQYRFERKDGEPNKLFDIRTHTDFSAMGIDSLDFTEISDGLDDESLKILQESQQEMAAENEELMRNTNLDLLPGLYRPSISHVEIPPIEYDFSNEEDDELFDEEHNHHLIEINGITIRFIENAYDVTMRIEGELPLETVNTLLRDITNNLTALEGAPYDSKKIE